MRKDVLLWPTVVVGADPRLERARPCGIETDRVGDLDRVVDAVERQRVAGPRTGGLYERVFAGVERATRSIRADRRPGRIAQRTPPCATT
jgi:hypothetical protein